MKALVTGAGGQLATELLAAPPDGWIVEAISEIDLDIRDAAAVSAAVARSATRSDPQCGGLHSGRPRRNRLGDRLGR